MSFARVKQFKDIEFSYSSSVASTVTFSSDMPGGVMAARATLTYPSTANVRKTLTLPLDGVEGTLYKVRFAPGNTGVARLFGGVLRARAIGVYMDGANGEIWEAQENGVGI